jgi:ABC-type polysaccharide/polyol phosphate transport system, ATPase component
VSKRYVLGEWQTAHSVRVAAAYAVRRVRRRAPPPEIWPLRDVSFAVSAGAALGVIGDNGAGKTTLLRVLSRITPPTSGFSRTRGRVATMIEAGAGFHPELTGRENIQLLGVVLGWSRRDIERRFDEIVAFADVPALVDTPVKRYSPGLCLRLAFAVTTHLEPDVLLVDEVLAAADREFRERCLRRLEVLRARGATIVYVSHDVRSVERLCSTSLWLAGGAAAAVGATTDVLAAYRAPGTGPAGCR